MKQPLDRTREGSGHLYDGLPDEELQEALEQPQQTARQRHTAPDASPVRVLPKQIAQNFKSAQTNAALRAAAVSRIGTLPSSECGHKYLGRC